MLILLVDTQLALAVKQTRHYKVRTHYEKSDISNTNLFLEELPLQKNTACHYPCHGLELVATLGIVQELMNKLLQKDAAKHYEYD